MRKSVWVFAIALAFTSVACSQTPPPDQPTREEVKRLLEVMGLREQMQNILELMAQSIKSQMQESIGRQLPELNDAQKKEFTDFINSVTDDAMRLMSVDEMLDLSIPIYMKHFSREDIQALSAFYSSPVGRKIITKMPAMSAESMTTVQVALQPRLEKMSQGMAERVAATLKRIEAAATPQ